MQNTEYSSQETGKNKANFYRIEYRVMRIWYMLAHGTAMGFKAL